MSMTIDEAIAYANEQKEIFGGKHREFLENLSKMLEELKAIRQWKADVIESFCKYDASSFEELVDNARAKAIDKFASTLIPRLTDAIYQKDVASMTNLINDVARELKEGADYDY